MNSKVSTPFALKGNPHKSVSKCHKYLSLL